MNMLDYFFTMLGIGLFTVIAIAMIEMSGPHRGARDDVSSLQQHPRSSD